MDTRPLVPGPIVAHAALGEHAGRFEGVAMAVDISGFTALCERLMRRGPAAAEVVSDLLGSVFAPAFDAVERHAGVVASLAGDGFTAVFRADPERARAAAEAVQAVFESGPAGVHARVGLAAGPIEWRLVGRGRPGPAQWYFRGAAIAAATDLQRQAFPGKVRAQEPLSVEGASTDWPAEPELAVALRADLLPASVVGFDARGEFRHVAAVFVGFDPAAPDATVATFVEFLLDECERYGGYLNKVDFGEHTAAALCVFGAPVAHEGLVARALELMHRVRQGALTSRWARLGVAQGMSYGLAFAGIVGGERRAEYTVLGDTVNLAARLMGIARTRRDRAPALLPAGLRQQAPRVFRFSEVGAVQLKGIGDAVPTLALATRVDRATIRYEVPFVGRDEALNEALRWGSAGEPLLYVYGEAGAGKTRLAFELQRHLSPKRRVLRLPSDQMLGKALHPFAQLAARVFEQSAERAPEDNLARFEARFEALVPTGAFEDLIAPDAFLKALLGLPTDGTTYTLVEPETRREHTLDALAGLVAGVAAQGAGPVGGGPSLLLVCEDIQWLDPDSRVALIRAIERAGDRVSVLATARYTRGLGGGHELPSLPLEGSARTIELGPLGEADVGRLAAAVLGGPVDDALRGLLVSQTAGNPFFVQQTALHLVEQGALARGGDGAWALSGALPDLPGSIRELLVARVDRLEAPLKELAQVAAVLGPSIDIQVLTEIHALLRGRFDPVSLLADLRAGEVQELWSLQGVRYDFQHGLLREALYELLLPSRRREMHAMAAEAILRVYPSDPGVFADLAFHFDKAGLVEEALEALEKAGDHALTSYALPEAERHYARGVELLPESGREDPEREVRLRHGEARAILWCGRIEEARERLEALVVWAQARGGLEGEARAWRGLARAREQVADYAGAKAAAARAVALLRARGGEETELAEALRSEAVACYRLRDFEAARATCEEVLATAASAKARAYAVNLMASIALAGARDEEGRRAALADKERALALFREVGDLRGVTMVLVGLGFVAFEAADYARSAALSTEALEAATRRGDRYHVMIALHNRGSARVRLGEAAQAREDLERTIRMAEAVGSRLFLAEAYAYLARAWLLEGDTERAEALASTALQIARDTADEADEREAWRTLAEVAARAGSVAIDGVALDEEACLSKV